VYLSNITYGHTWRDLKTINQIKLHDDDWRKTTAIMFVIVRCICLLNQYLAETQTSFLVFYDLRRLNDSGKGIKDVSKGYFFFLILNHYALYLVSTLISLYTSISISFIFIITVNQHYNNFNQIYLFFENCLLSNSYMVREASVYNCLLVRKKKRLVYKYS
jgi:hypothetical protein